MHPFERWFDASLRPLFRASLVLSFVTMAALGTVDATLRCPTSPLGIVSFEIAGTRAQEVLDGWSETQRRDAMLVQGLDYLFLVVYSTALASAALLMGRGGQRRSPRLASLARPVAWGFTLSGLSDAIENTPMVLMLRTGVADATGATTTLVFASAKFVLLVIGLSYLLLMLVAGRGTAASPTVAT